MTKFLLLLVAQLIFSLGCAQYQMENLAFEGAGIRGLAYCGAIHALEETNQLQYVKRISGTSAGAITALLLSIGYSSKEIENIIGGTNFRKFNDGGFPLVGGAQRLVKKYGWYKGEKFQKWLEKLVAKKTDNGKISFEEISQRFKALYITGTSVSSQRLIVFSAENYPKMPVVNAVRISMSIPFYFQAVFMQPDGSIDKKPRKNRSYEIMVDGGTMANFPLTLFDSSKYIDASTTNLVQINKGTLGFRIDRATQIALDSTSYSKELTKMDVKGFGSYVTAYIVLLTERLNRQQLTQNDFDRSVLIKDGGISPKIRAMKKAEINLLVQNGYDATMEYFTKNRIDAKPLE
jgi:NTE family protein